MTFTFKWHPWNMKHMAGYWNLFICEDSKHHCFSDYNDDVDENFTRWNNMN